jgi:hypothetical protein
MWGFLSLVAAYKGFKAFFSIVLLELIQPPITPAKLASGPTSPLQPERLSAST